MQIPLFIVEEIEKHEARRIAGIIAQDFEALRSLMPEDLTHIHSNGLVQNREELFDRIGTVINFLHIERGELSYRMYGDVVVAVGPMHVRTRLIESGMESSSDAVVTQVWVRQDKGWTQVAFQSART